MTSYNQRKREKREKLKQQQITESIVVLSVFALILSIFVN